MSENFSLYIDHLLNLLICLFSPTPSVEWVKLGETLPPRAEILNFGKLLNISRGSEKDDGKYMCKAKNVAGEHVHYFDVVFEGTVLHQQDMVRVFIPQLVQTPVPAFQHPC